MLNYYRNYFILFDYFLAVSS